MQAATDRRSRWLHPKQWGLVALFFALYELAAQNSFGLLECSLAAALLGWGWEILRQSRGSISLSIRRVCAAEGQRLVCVCRKAESDTQTGSCLYLGYGGRIIYA